MGAYTSVPQCQSQYNVTVNCSIVFTDDTNTTAQSIGTITKGEFLGDPDIAGVGVSMSSCLLSPHAQHIP
jgi:hypothetical protein